ncbi:MAG: hypothetical protein V1753_12240 [Pseudomonadota bacterium]
MLKKRLLTKGQSLLEVAILMGVVTLAILVMQTYIKRGVQGKTKDLTDIIIGTQQRAYVAESQTSKTTSTVSAETTISTESGGGLTKTVDETVTSTASATSIGKD